LSLSFFGIGILNGTVSRSLHSPPVAFEEIEKRVSGPLPYSSQRQHRNKISIPGDAADLTARPMSSNQNAQYRYKALPPIHSQQQQKQRRNGNVPSSNRSDQLLDNQRRISRFIKHIK
jgi:hypothetical protein